MTRLGRSYPVERIFVPGIVPVLFDAVGAGGHGNATSGSWTHVAAAGTYALATVTTSAGATVTAATYGATAMTVLGSIPLNNVAGNGAVTLLGLANVAGGSSTIAVTMSTTHSFSGNSVSYKNVAAVGAPVTAFGSSATASLAATAGPGQLVVRCFGGELQAFTTNTGGTQRSLTSNSGSGANMIVDTSASGTLTGTFAASTPWSVISVALIAA